MPSSTMPGTSPRAAGRRPAYRCRSPAGWPTLPWTASSSSGPTTPEPRTNEPRVPAPTCPDQSRKCGKRRARPAPPPRSGRNACARSPRNAGWLHRHGPRSTTKRARALAREMEREAGALDTRPDRDDIDRPAHARIMPHRRLCRGDTHGASRHIRDPWAIGVGPKDPTLGLTYTQRGPSRASPTVPGSEWRPPCRDRPPRLCRRQPAGLAGGRYIVLNTRPVARCRRPQPQAGPREP
jgi:hypothetical protein